MTQQRIANGCGIYGSPGRRIMPARRTLNRLDARRRKLIKGVSQGMNITEAGQYAGYAHRQAAHRALRSIQLQLPEALESAGYPVDKVLTEIVEKLRSQLEAKKTRFFKYRGVVTDVRVVEAHNVQLRAAAQICKLLGVY